MASPTIKNEIVRKYLKKFPNSPNAVLSRKIYKENATSFVSVEAIRTMIRMITGNSGEKNRVKTTNKNSYKAPKKSNDYCLPESYSNDFTFYEIKQSRTLIIGDLHFPYQNNKAITLALDYGKTKKVDCILINGDLIDFANISRHERDFRARSIAEEFDAVRAFLK